MKECVKECKIWVKMKNSLFTALLIAFELHQSDLETIICNTIFKMNIAIPLLHFSPQTSVQFSFKLETMPLDFRRSKSNTCIQNRQDDIKILFTLA